MFIRTHSECRAEMMVWQENLKKDSPPRCSFPSHYEIPNVQLVRNAVLSSSRREFGLWAEQTEAERVMETWLPLGQQLVCA